MQLETERLLLRIFQPDDLPEYYRLIYSDPAVMVYLPGGVPRTLERTREVLEGNIRLITERGYTLWAVIHKTTGAFMGHCGLYPLPTGEVELAYALGLVYWGQGYASEAARVCLDYGLTTCKLPAILALAVPQNLASQRVMEKAGMQRIGLTEDYYNTRLMLYRLDAPSM
jgi:RimJ/RimL family protein N-acetyltransferase